MTKDFYLYSMTINPKKPAEKRCYSEKDLRSMVYDLNIKLAENGCRVAIVYSISNKHLSGHKQKKEKGHFVELPKIYANYHIHASMLAFDYDEIEHAAWEIKDYLENRYGKFPTLVDIKGYNIYEHSIERKFTIEEAMDLQQKNGYAYYPTETKNAGFYFLYQKAQQHGRAIIYNETERAISDVRSFENIIINNNMINDTNQKGLAKLQNNILAVGEVLKEFVFVTQVAKGVLDVAHDRIEDGIKSYKKTGSDIDLKRITQQAKDLEKLILSNFMPLIQGIGMKAEFV